MVSLSHVQKHVRFPGVTWTRRHLRLRRRMRRSRPEDAPTRPSGARSRTLAQRLTPVRRALEHALRLGAGPSLPRNANKRIRLCNFNALGGTVIMATWAVIEAVCGDRGNLPWELGFLAAFVAVLALNAIGSHRSARLLLVVTVNICVFAGCLLFTAPSGGILPFFGIAAIALLLFGPDEWLLATLGAALPAVLLIACKTGIAASLFAVDPRPAPAWYFAANAATTFALAFLVPLFFYRSNLKAETSLQRMGQEKLKRVLDADLIGVVRGRLSGPIEDANDTFLDLLGYTRQDLAAGALDLRMIAPLHPFLSELSRRGPTSVYERKCRRKDGTDVCTLVGVAFLDESDDEVVAFVLDLTAQKHLEAEQEMLLDSREALRLRDLFNSIASHELKTPLTALLLSLQLMRKRLDREAPNSPTLHAQVDRCESAARRMGELIDALLDVARIHRGRFTLDLRDVDVVEAVRKSVSAFDVCKNGGGRQIAVSADGAVTARLDPLRFDQVVTNLLSNAIKYGNGKPIEVHVRRDRAADAARVEVIDRGPGIDPSMAEKIFEPFQRAASQEPIPGLGLGLYVVKLIVESHGGHIAVDSKPGRGARFIVDLPRGGQPQQQMVH
jgi:signal transduction histidine kinase